MSKRTIKIFLGAATILLIGYAIYKYFGASLGLKVSATKEDLVAKCKSKCKSWHNTCTAPCLLLDEETFGLCTVACEGSKLICDHTCTGKSGLRNGSLHHIAVFNKDKQYLTTLKPWEPRQLDLQIDDFPIYATRCGTIEGDTRPDRVPMDCDMNNTRWVLRIDDPGCFIIWGGGIFPLYTTVGACGFE